MNRHPPSNRIWVCTLTTLLLGTSLAHSQSVCSSDSQAQPQALFERFINADCATCWADTATPTAPPGALVLDWIVPGDQGDEAALSAAASSDALARLQDVQRARPDTQDRHDSRVDPLPGATLRVARGPAVANYVGVSVTLTLPQGASPALPLSGWVVLVQALPSGVEGSPVSRNIIRNAFQPIWNVGNVLSNKEQLRFHELRAMSIPERVQADSLTVVAWIQDAHGRILAAAQSVCPPEDKTEPGTQTR